MYRYINKGSRLKLLIPLQLRLKPNSNISSLYESQLTKLKTPFCTQGQRFRSV